MGNTQTAAIDADFIFHIAEIQRPKAEIIRIVKAVFAERELFPVIHPLVYSHEIDPPNGTIDSLFRQSVIKLLSFNPDIFQSDPQRKAYYQYLVPELYHHLTGSRELDGKDIFTFWERRASLGETHSIAMCLVCDFGIFLSDDADSKTLKHIVEQRMSLHIDVYNRQELIEQCTSGCDLTRTDRRIFCHKSKR